MFVHRINRVVKEEKWRAGSYEKYFFLRDESFVYFWSFRNKLEISASNSLLDLNV